MASEQLNIPEFGIIRPVPLPDLVIGTTTPGILVGPEPTDRARIILPDVIDVISNGPATVVRWSDGEKTVVKCSECGDGKCRKLKGYERDPEEPLLSRPIFCEFHNDPEKAVMAAMLKRFYPDYLKVLRRFVTEEGDDE